MPAILAVDVGTSSMKGGIVDDTGAILSWARVPLSSGTTNFEEWKPARWDTALLEIFGRLTSDPNAVEVDGIALSGNGPTLVAIDADGNPLGEALMWLDGREKRVSGERSFFLPKAAWMCDNDGQRYAETDLFLPCAEYLNFRLTGNAAAVSPSTGFDDRFWTPEGVSRYGLDWEKFPPLVRVGATVGSVSRSGAECFGVSEGTPVYASGSDFLMALIGTGTVFPGRTCDRAGTSEGINHCSDVDVSSPSLRTLPHVIPGYHNVAGILSSTGRIFEWFRSISGQTEVPYNRMLANAASLSHTAQRPYFFPSLHRGATWEFSGGIFTELEPETGPQQMGRAVVEAIGFSVRDVIRELEANGCNVSALRVTGGQARNHVWSQMKADITGKQILVPAVVDAELVGSACAGLVGSGMFSNVTEASEILVNIATSFEPNDEEHDQFATSYEQYCEVRDTVIGALADYRNRASRVE